jgi:hypothetical protein
MISETQTGSAVGPGAGKPVAVASGLIQAGSVAGFALVALLLAGAIAEALGVGWAGGLRSWLLLIRGVHSGEAGITFDALRRVRAVDIAVLVLAGVTFLGMRPALGAPNRVWVAIAAATPLVGIVALWAGEPAGRMAMMVGGLVLARRMMKRDRYRLLGLAGVAANGLLLLAELDSTGSPDPLVGEMVVLGYALFVAWLVWLLVRMLRPLPGRAVPVGTHIVGRGGGCRVGGSDTTELFDLPLYSRPEGALGTYVGAADESTRFTVNGESVTMMRFLEAYDEDIPFEVRVEEPGRLATMVIDTRDAPEPPATVPHV